MLQKAAVSAGRQIRVQQAWRASAASAWRRSAATFQQRAVQLPDEPRGVPSVATEAASNVLRPRKTEIICTIGPASWDAEVLAQLIDEGMNTIRCNMSHGDHAEQTMKVENLHKAYSMRPAAKDSVKILMDTRGPEIRTGYFEVYNSKKILKSGQRFTLVTDYEVKGDETKVAITYKQLPQDVKPGQIILVQDGTVILKVLESGSDYVVTEVQNDCRLGEKKNVNVPGVHIDLPVVDEREIRDLTQWAVRHRAAYIALSFVQTAQDIRDCRKHCSPEMKIIAKIENVEGIVNFSEILQEADGIMVARGDLGMQIPMERIWMAQKWMLQQTSRAGKIGVVATEMLASMEDKPFPTRAEACDVANAVLDGCNMVMLSSETANGKFPDAAVRRMRRIVEEVERSMC